MKIGDDLSLELRLRVPEFSGWREIWDVRVTESSGMIYHWDRGRTSGGSGVVKVAR